METSALTKRRKRRKGLLVAVVSIGLILVAWTAFAFVQSFRTRFRLWDRDFDPNRPHTSQQRAQRDLDMAMVCLSDQFLLWSFSGQAHEEGFSAAFFTRCVAEFEKVDVTRCPDDFRAARAAVLAALREFGTKQGSVDGVDPRWNAVVGAATAYMKWEQLKPAFEAYRLMLSRYQINLDFSPAQGLIEAR